MLKCQLRCAGHARSTDVPALSTCWPSQLPHLNHLGYSSTACRHIASKRPASTLAANSSSTPQAAASTSLITCRRCKQRFSEASNSRDACRHHPALYSGGEVAKAIGFVRASDAPKDQLEAVVGRKGLMRFWDCCGSEDEGAPGCCVGFHVSFDDELNEAKGWR